MRWPSALLIAWILLPLAARAQEEKPRTIPFEGPEIFCHLLFSEGAKPILTVNEAFDDPKQSVIIALGKPSRLSLQEFAKNGGSILVATDYRFGERGFAPIQISGSPITHPEELSYRGHIQCPLLTYASGVAERDVRDHPLFSFLQKGIATNCPSRVQIASNVQLQSLLEFPVKAGSIRRDVWSYMVGSPKDAPPEGRSLYIAGNGMFMNGMMAQFDNDNSPFTLNAIRWLRETADKENPRNVLLMVDGTIITDFDMKLTPPLPPIPIPPVKALNRLIRGLENERFFHRVVSDLVGNAMGRIIAAVLGVLTFIGLLYGAKKFMEGRHHLETGVPRFLGPQQPPTAAPADQRTQALLRQRDFWNEASQLTFEWFRQQFDVAPHRWRAEVHAELAVEGFFWGRRSLQRRADFVLRLARSAHPLDVSRHEFFVLVEALRDLNAALEAGQVALLVEGKNVKQP